MQEVLDQQQVNDFQQNLMMKNERAQNAKDSVTINNYLAEKGVSAMRTASGLRYIVTREGQGEYAASGKTAYVHYAGYNLSGKLFDTSIAEVAQKNNFDNQGRNEPYPVTVNTGTVIRGWDEMLMLMNKGMKVTVYIPSALAYGPQSRGPEIPANSILIFDMEVTDIK